MTRLPAVVAFALALAVTARTALADTVLDRAIDTHIMPAYERLRVTTAALAATCPETCAPDDPALSVAYGEAFDAWMGVAHLRFGPGEVEQRAFALAFWPDPRGSTTKALSRMLRADDTASLEPETFAKQSVAARGLYALERLIHEDPPAGDPIYRDRLIAAVANDIAATAAAIADAWADGYAETLRTAGAPGNDTYLSVDEGRRELFTALSTGLETTAEVRLGLPLGSFERPRPRLAEARRSGRSRRHVVLSLEALRDLAAILAAAAPPDVAADVDAGFARALDRATDSDDPVFAGVAEPRTRIAVEALQNLVNAVRSEVGSGLGPALGIASGFNSLDGD